MSSFALETNNLIDNKMGLAGINIIANVGLSLAAIIAGMLLMASLIKGGLQ